MNRVLILVEGQTEETFIRDLLARHLESSSIFMTPVILSTKRIKSGLKFKGGVGSFQQFKRDLQRLLGDRGATAVTMMVDYYGLPRDFPGAGPRGRGMSCYTHVKHLEESLRSEFPDPRFIPYLSLHEFEALLLTSPDHIMSALPKPGAVSKLASILASVKSPEEINDGSETHPSARLTRILPTYRKRLHGPLITSRIGLDVIRRQCPHFDQWLTCLEDLQS